MLEQKTNCSIFNLSFFFLLANVLISNMLHKLECVLQRTSFSLQRLEEAEKAKN